ncbi:transposase [Yersinia pseudotuberculosis]|nr:transposase [Yersinia pseudotuberculosis]
MDVWVTAQECVGLPGLPSMQHNIRANLDKLAGEERRKRAGSKAFEYHINCLPPVARAAVLKAQGTVEINNQHFDIIKRPSDAYCRESLWQHWNNASNKQREKAREKCEAVIAVAGLIDSSIDTLTAFDSVGEALNVSSANVRRWYYLAKPFDRTDWLAALVSKHGQCMTARKMKEAECSAEAWDFFLADFLRLEQPALRTCYARLEEAAAAHNWTIPSLSSLRRKLEREVPAEQVVLLREGQHAVMRLYPAQERSVLELDAMEWINGDGYQHNVFVRWFNGEIIRPKTWVWQDIRTRKILGYRTDVSENSDSIRLALADVVEQYGIPKHITIDNTRAAANKWMTGGVPNRYRFKVKEDDPAWFQTHPDDRNNLRLRDGSYHGAELQPFGWIQHYAKSKSGYLARTGLIRTLVWPFIFKNYSVRDLAEFLEIYGLPIRVGQYPAGATDKEKQTLLQAVMSIGHNAGGIIPRSMLIDFKAAADGTADPFLAMMSWAELSMSKAILGGTLTSQADGASSTNALGNVHNEVRYEVCSSDATQLAATLTRDLLFPLYVFNCQSYNNQRRHPRFEFDLSEPEDVSTYATALPSLVGMGMKIPLQWAHDKLQIPIAARDEDCLKAMAPAPDFSQALLRARDVHPGYAALSATPQPTDVMPDAVSGEQWQAAIDPLLTPIIEALKSGGYAAAKTKADELYVGMDDAQIADILHRAMFVAETWGRLNATAG